MGPTISAPFREVVGLGGLYYQLNGIVWSIIRDLNKAIDTGEWSICPLMEVAITNASIGTLHIPYLPNSFLLGFYVLATSKVI